MNIHEINDCPDCGSNNVIHGKLREQVICRDCGLIFEPAMPIEPIKPKPAAATRAVAKPTPAKKQAKKKVKKKVKKKKAKKKVKKKAKPKKKAKKKKKVGALKRLFGFKKKKAKKKKKK